MEQKAKEKCPSCGQEMNDKAKAKKLKIENLKELYKHYYEGKDYHLKRFWENSIFVWTFLMVCFTAYGFLISKFLEGKFCDESKNLFPILSSFICIIACTLSLLWLWMAKGSKAWYEVYENAIWNMESLRNVFSFEHESLIHNYWSLKTDKDFNNKTFFEKIFSVRGFSPSKIVILIGWLLVIFWICAFVFGILIYFNICCLNIFVTCIISFMIIFIFFKTVKDKIKSSSLRDYSDEILFNRIKSDKFIRKMGIYFEVNDNQVKFYTKSEKQKKQIISHYNDSPSNDIQNWLHFERGVINGYYDKFLNISTEQSELISEKFQIDTKFVKVFNKTVFVNFEGSDYEKDNLKIAKIVNELLKEKDFDTIKVNYNLITNLD
ncbi:MAG: hypothetical protein IKQ46_01755 [Bacteroidales bacterium]|nr:hypothetical protein [Bacteroidales bacterium]